MVLEHTGGMTDVNMKECTKTIRNMALAPTLGLMVVPTKVTG